MWKAEVDPGARYACGHTKCINSQPDRLMFSIVGQVESAVRWIGCESIQIGGITLIRIRCQNNWTRGRNQLKRHRFWGIVQKTRCVLSGQKLEDPCSYTDPSKHC